MPWLSWFTRVVTRLQVLDDNWQKQHKDYREQIQLTVREGIELNGIASQALKLLSHAASYVNHF